MPSPFPGMDPYLESPAYWPDFHGRFINTVCEAIADTLPDAYFARIQEDVVLLEPEGIARKVVPDVVVGADDRFSGAGSSTAAMLEFVTLPNIVQIDPHTEFSIEIVRWPDAEVVSVVELLSPSNKSGDGRGIYTDKRNRLLQRNVNLIEIDLLRSGRRIELAAPFPKGHYHVLISRADHRPDCQVSSWSVRQALPTIAIPLSHGVPDASADLAKAFTQAYDRGRYHRMVRYGEPCPPHGLTPDDIEWIESIARAVVR